MLYRISPSHFVEFYNSSRGLLILILFIINFEQNCLCVCLAECCHRTMYATTLLALPALLVIVVAVVPPADGYGWGRPRECEYSGVCRFLPEWYYLINPFIYMSVKGIVNHHCFVKCKKKGFNKGTCAELPSNCHKSKGTRCVCNVRYRRLL